ncbi:MAG: DUF2071 domain-containing protein [Actinomycetota bacterium]|nr:DUF2071 domain-containing protein [Actinomycetota bacterium]
MNTVRTTTVPGDDQRPDRGPRVKEAEVDLENFVLVTHAVPAERVRRILPERLTLETFDSEDGREMTLVTTSCFCNRDLRWSVLPRPTHTFNQSTFRTYVTYGRHRGSYFFGDYVDTVPSFLTQGAMASGTRYASYDLDIQRSGAGYSRYSCTARAGKQVLRFVAEAEGRARPRHPFTDGSQKAQFITYRLHGFARNAAGFYTHGRVDHRRLKPFSGTLLEGRFDFWADLGVLPPEEFRPAFSVLVEPNVRFVLLPPRPARL